MIFFIKNPKLTKKNSGGWEGRGVTRVGDFFFLFCQKNPILKFFFLFEVMKVIA